MTAPARPLLLMAIIIGGVLLFPGPLRAATPSDPNKRAVEHATELWRSGDADAAIAFLEKSTEAGGSAEAYHLLGQIYFKAKKKPREAAEAFTHALKLKPAYPDALNDLAEVYLAQGKAAEAEQTLKRALEVEPKHEDSYLDLARLYDSRHDIPAAMQVYQRLLAVRPTSADGLFGLAMLYEAEGNNDSARKLLARLTKAHPTHATDGIRQAVWQNGTMTCWKPPMRTGRRLRPSPTWWTPITTWDLFYAARTNPARRNGSSSKLSGIGPSMPRRT